MNPTNEKKNGEQTNAKSANAGTAENLTTKSKVDSKANYSFELQKHPKKKGVCPNCNKKDCFRYYEGLPIEYGICDHKNKCNWHKNPYDEPLEVKLELSGKANVQKSNLKEPIEPKIIFPDDEMLSRLLENQSTNFHKACSDKLKISKDHYIKWAIGGENGATCFIYQNSKNALNVKKISYNESCKRDKAKVPFSLSAPKGSKYLTCLYGENLLSQDKKICLVESEKTAFIASYFYKDFDWLATGGSNGLTVNKVQSLKGREVLYIQDSDKAGKENSTLKKLKQYNINFKIVDLYPERNDGYDLADAIFDGLLPEIKPTLNTEQVEFCFYTPVYFWDKDKGEKVIKNVIINYTAWTDLLFSMGYRRFDLDTKEFTLIKIEKQIIAEVTIQQVQDEFINYIKNIPIDDQDMKMAIIEKFYKNIGHYFNLNRLSLLKHQENFTFNADTKNESFIYFRNGYVKVDKDGWDLFDYNTLKGCIWKNQIIDRDFSKLELKEYTSDQLPVFAKFMVRISGEKDRFFALCSIIGYNLHNFFDTKLKATILTDSTVSDEAEGRTGKTLLAKGLSYIRTYVEIPGKNFDVNDKYRYSKCNLDSQIVHLNDAKQYFNFETLYNDITEGVTVDKKNKEPFNIRVKMIVSTNKTIKIDGASSRDRSIEFELAECYNDRYQPKDEFGHWFFTDWEKIEWIGFDNFMIYCLFVYFNNGLMQPSEINLKKRKLLDETCSEFIEFITEKDIQPNYKYSRDEWHKSFLESYPDIRDDKHRKTMKTFTKYLKTYALNSDKFKKLGKEDLGRSNNTNWVVFKTK